MYALPFRIVRFPITDDSYEVVLSDLEKQQATNTPRKKEIQNYLSAECLTREMLDAFVDCIYVYGEHSIQIQWLFDEI